MPGARRATIHSGTEHKRFAPKLRSEGTGGEVAPSRGAGERAPLANFHTHETKYKVAQLGNLVYGIAFVKMASLTTKDGSCTLLAYHPQKKHGPANQIRRAAFHKNNLLTLR